MKNNFQSVRAVVALVLVFAFSSFAQKQLESQPPPLSPAEASRQGRALTEEILAQVPAQNVTNAGVLRIRDAQSKRTEIPIEFNVVRSAKYWTSIFETRNADRDHFASLIILHFSDRPNRYIVPNVNPPPADTNAAYDLKPDQLFNSFAGSDFWLCDLGLEFFHWPQQKLLKTELRKSRECKVLESINPQPGTNSYSRVVSWIDVESDGIIHAEAYDAQNKLLKEFDTKKFKKVKSEWQLEEMEIRNVQTDSRSQIEFNLDQK